MAWVAPRTWVSGNVLTAAQLNVDVRDNENALSLHTHTGVAGDGATLSVLSRDGGNTTEATTTSTVAVDILTATVSIATGGIPLNAMVMLRKTTGAAGVAYLLWKVNATVLGSEVIWTAASINQTEAALAELRTRTYMDANYSGATAMATGVNEYIIVSGAATSQALYTAIPNASITSVIVRGRVQDALITMGADELHVYTYPTS